MEMPRKLFTITTFDNLFSLLKSTRCFWSVDVETVGVDVKVWDV